MGAARGGLRTGFDKLSVSGPQRDFGLPLRLSLSKPARTRYTRPMPITLSAPAHAAMLSAAAAAHPREACGLLLGEGDGIRAATSAANVHPDPLTRFEIDPAALIAAHKAARAGGPKLVGYWHSHPNGHPRPSATDCEHAGGDGAIWAIVANNAVSVWRDTPNGFEPLSYRMVDG